MDPELYRLKGELLLASDPSVEPDAEVAFRNAIDTARRQSTKSWELRAATPFIDMRLLVSNLALTRTYLRGALTLLSFYTVLYGLTQWLQAGRGLSAEEAGLLILPMGALAAVIIRPISARNLVRGPLLAAALSLLVASVGVVFLTTHSPVILIVGVTLVFGITTGTTTG